MTERPILFSAEMVRAILDGRKTQTRRAIKPVPTFNGGGACHDADALQQDYVELHWVFPEICKYGAPGDLLWVRETVAHGEGLKYHVAYKADSQCGAWGWDGDGNPLFSSHGHVLEGDAGRAVGNYGMHRYGKRWTPSIHMPRWASRITLEVKSVRVERLQDISEDDARAEGCEPVGWIDETDVGMSSYREGFTRLWNTINGPGAWDANPWVWVVAFERMKP